MNTLIQEYAYISELRALGTEASLYDKYKDVCTTSQKNIYELGLLYWAYRFEEAQPNREGTALRHRLIEDVIDRMEKCSLKHTRNVERFHTKLSQEDKKKIIEQESTKGLGFSDYFGMDNVPPYKLFELLNFAIENAPAEKLANCATIFYRMVKAHQKQLAYSRIISGVREFCLREDFEEERQDEMVERLFHGAEFRLWRKRDNLDVLTRTLARTTGTYGTSLSRKIELEKIHWDDEKSKKRENEEEFKDAKARYLLKDARNFLAAAGRFVANCATLFYFEEKINTVLTPGFPQRSEYGLK